MDSFDSNLDGYYDVKDQLPRRLRERACEHFAGTHEHKAAIDSVDEHKRRAAATHKAEGFCAAGFMMRSALPTEQAIELREAGRAGSSSHVHVAYLRCGRMPGDRDSWFTDPNLARAVL